MSNGKTNRGAIAIAIAIVMGIAGLSLVGCPEESDTTPPAQVTELAQVRSVDGTSVTLSWENPVEIDLRTIRITVTPALPAPARPNFPLDVSANGASMSQSQTITGVDATTEYTFTVRTVDTAGNESDSSSAPTVTSPGLVIDTTPPEPVTGLAQVRSVGGTSVTLSWTNPADTDLAVIRIAVTPALPAPARPIFPLDVLDVQSSGSSMNQSQTITGIDDAIDYTFTFRTIDTVGNISDSPSVPTVISPAVMDITPPVQATDLAFVANGNSVTLSWKNPADADLSHVSITWTPDISGPTQPIETAKDAITQIIANLDENIAHTFTIRTVDTAGNISALSGAPTVTSPAVDTAPPAPVTALTQTRSVGGTSVTLSWTNPADTDLAVIRIAVTPALPAPARPIFPLDVLDVQSSGSSMNQSQTITGIDDAIDYTFTFRTIDTVGNISDSSNAPTVISPAVMDITPPAPVTALTQTRSVDKISVTLSWTNPADADLNSISIAVEPALSGFPVEPMASGPSMSQTRIVTGVHSATEYTFTIIAVDAAGNRSAAVTVVSASLGFTAIGAGSSHTCALRNGAISCWGQRTDGILGISGSATGIQPTPVTVPLTSVSALSLATFHTCAIADTIDTAYCWGRDTNGQLGNGATAGTQRTPVAVLSGESGTGTNLINVSAISAGAKHTCAIAGADNAAYCWGSALNGRLGNGATTGNQFAPVAVRGPTGTAALTGVTAIFAGGTHTCAIAGANNAAYCWGAGMDGRLGNGNAAATNQSAPVAVRGPTAGTTLTGATDIFAGGAHTCAIANGTPYCWGIGENGRLGNNSTSNRSRPVLVVAVNEMGTPPTSGTDRRTPLAAVTSFGINTADIANPAHRSCAVAGASGTAYCWGERSNALGIGAGTADQLRPAAVQGVGGTGVLSGIIAISAGAFHTCAISPTAAYCWGDDAAGQLGNGATVTASQSSPVDITNLIP